MHGHAPALPRCKVTGGARFPPSTVAGVDPGKLTICFTEPPLLA